MHTAIKNAAQGELKANDGLRMTAQDISMEHYEFGGKTAERTGALLSGDREALEVRQATFREEARIQTAARGVDWHVQLAALTFEEKIEKTMECLNRRAAFQNILYGLLVFCQKERSYDEAEAHVESYVEFASNSQSARRYLLFLLRTGAIEEIELDDEGAVITAERRQTLLDGGLSKDEMEAFVVDWCVTTTDVGREVARLFHPRVRLRSMLASQDSRLPTYHKILAFCVERRSLAEVSALLVGDPGLEIDEETGVIGMQPNSYIGKLDQAGGLAWDGGWITTKEGREVVEALQ